jgi:hypothetical protein
MESIEEFFYNGKVFKVLFKYDSGFWEMVEKDSVGRVILVHKDELTLKK